MSLKTNYGYQAKSHKFLIFLGFILVCLCSVAEGTEVGGQILKSTTWNLERSPFILTGDVQIRNNSELAEIVELRIEPGVEVDLNGFTIRAGEKIDKGAYVCHGRMVADRVRFFGKGRVVLAYGNENYIVDCVFDSISLVLGGTAGTISSGKIQNITMNHADINIYAGKWEITGGKLLNGTISYKALDSPVLSQKETQYINFFMNMMTMP